MKKEIRIIQMPNKDDRIPVVILANGTYPSKGIARFMLSSADKVVCCDGAANKYMSRGGVPYAIAGDCDSVSDEFRRSYSGIIYRDSDQNYNDLTKAVRFCVSEGLSEILILGATGEREDHTLGNISLLAEYVSYDGIDRIRMITDYGVFNAVTEQCVLESFAGQQVSLFCIDPETRVTTLNLRYPLTDTPLKNWWQGTLNESTKSTFEIKTEGTVIVFREFRFQE